MDALMMIISSPYLYIGLEVAAILVLLYFVRKWAKLQKQWMQEKESAAERAKEDELLKMIANHRRTH